MPPSRARLRALPKIDLHRHLEGSITPETLLRVARYYGGSLPTHDLAELRRRIQIDPREPGFAGFLSRFAVFRGFYPSREAIEDIARTAVRQAARDNVKYLELRWSPTHFAGGRFEEADVMGWIARALEQAERDYDIVVASIVTVSRDFGVDLARQTLETVLARHPQVFCGIDIAGNELANSAAPYADLFRMAKSAGPGVTIHAGEAGGAENVRAAVEDFGADRVGHGIRAIDDPRVVELLRTRNVLLEVCLSSNLHTASVAAIADHPLRQLQAAGIAVCLNSDDPAISHISLTDEYALAVCQLGMTEQDLDACNRTALTHAFYPDRAVLRRRLNRWWP